MAAKTSTAFHQLLKKPAKAASLTTLSRNAKENASGL